jgi:hypothetical protein
MTLYTEQALKVVGLPNGLPVKVSLLLPNTLHPNLVQAMSIPSSRQKFVEFDL